MLAGRSGRRICGGRPGVLVAAIAVTATAVVSASAAPARVIAPAPAWMVVTTHPDRTGKTIGFDLVSQSGVRSLTRRAAGMVNEDSGPTFSPDGSQVAFRRSGLLYGGLYVVATAGGTARRVLHRVVNSISWSPDGSQLAVDVCTTKGATCSREAIDIVNLDGSNVHRVFDFGGVVSWSPDGSALVCRCEAHAGNHYIVRLIAVGSDGTGAQQLNDPSDGSPGDPAWSPDGRWIAYGQHCQDFHLPDDTFCDTAVMAADGSNKRTLVRYMNRRGAGTEAPTWSSGGKLLIRQWGYLLHQITSIDPTTGFATIVRHELGYYLTAGPSGSFGFLREDSATRVWLTIAASDGATLLHARVQVRGDPQEFIKPAQFDVHLG